MASALPSLPNNRLAWDRDGALLEYRSEAATLRELSAADRETANDESSGYPGGAADAVGYWVVLLAEPMDLTHYFWATRDGNNNSLIVRIEASTDTTNGADGTWFEVDGDPMTPDNIGGWREDWKALAGADAVVGIRLESARLDRHQPRAIHLYGTYANTTAALMVWDPDSDQRVDGNHFNWGDAMRDTTDTRRFRVKNTTADQAAEGVTLSTEALTDSGSPTNVSQHDFSDDGGGSFADPLDIGNLDPGEISGELLLRRDLQTGAALGAWALRVVVEATSWSETS